MRVTDAEERASKGYDDKKEFTCVCCGKPVLLTKFASAKTAKCPECKTSNAPINPDLVPTSTPKRKQSEITGYTKTLPCVKCGTMVEVSKFMSAAKVLCDDCKGESGGIHIPMKLKIDTSKMDKDMIPTIDDYNILPSNIANRKLRKVTCPACGEEHMRIVNILDYSSFGLIIHYQCNKCKLLLSVSEQCKFRCATHKMGVMYDYSGNAIQDMMNAITSTRVYNTISILYKMLEEHNIPIEGIELPPYLYEEDKPVPVGFEIPPADVWVKTIDDVIKVLDNSERQGADVDMPEGTRYITISDTLAKEISSKLKDLLKEDK